MHLKRPSEIDCKAAFLKIDKDQNGTLDRDELILAFRELSIVMKDEFLDKMIYYVDQDDNKVLDLAEYRQMVYIFMNHVPNNLPHYLFLIADRDVNGYINPEELQILFKKINAGLSADEVQKLAIYSSGRPDGCISYDRFISMIKEILE
uniref:EF-hand domain pair-containing protein n=1 Tax=Trepomonas sp. PC1 TaxID=1076344 RepID=A0A146K982_9EUKA|eukprot:JAP92116.1 EF-hand domain pair-containing protein [Trepomonas sp. PC1]